MIEPIIDVESTPVAEEDTFASKALVAANTPNMFTNFLSKTNAYKLDYSFIGAQNLPLNKMMELSENGVSYEAIHIDITKFKTESDINIMKLNRLLEVTDNAWMVNTESYEYYPIGFMRKNEINFTKWQQDKRYDRCIGDLDFIIQSTGFKLPSMAYMPVLLQTAIGSMVINKTIEDEKMEKFIRILMKNKDVFDDLAKSYAVMLSKYYRKINPNNIALKWHLISSFKYLSAISIVTKDGLDDNTVASIKRFFNYVILPLIKETQIYKQVGMELDEIIGD